MTRARADLRPSKPLFNKAILIWGNVKTWVLVYCRFRRRGDDGPGQPPLAHILPAIGARKWKLQRATDARFRISSQTFKHKEMEELLRQSLATMED